MLERPLHVLLIDDDEDEYILVKDLLSQNGSGRFIVEWVDNYETAKEKVISHSHDVFLLDNRLGAKTGADLLREVVTLGHRVPIIFLTGLKDANLDYEIIKEGATDYIYKTEMTASLLEKSIRYAIYRTQMQEQFISQDRMASIGLLASSLAHEIGTPLGVIRGRAEYLSIQVAHIPNVQKNVDVILSQIDRVSTLIRSLLNLARGDSTGHLEKVSVLKAIESVLDLTSHDLRRVGVETHINIDAKDNVWILGEPEKLHQVLLNLVVNSIHAIDEAKKQGRPHNHSITFAAHDAGSVWKIDIIDTGCGIPSESLPHLFRPFFTTKDVGQGTGLGLATSQWILQSWGGAIEVESVDRVGTTFSLKVPKYQMNVPSKDEK